MEAETTIIDGQEFFLGGKRRNKKGGRKRYKSNKLSEDAFRREQSSPESGRE